MTERLPRLALVGRPNVGKSTLFNRLIGKRVAIVEDTPGVTRDRHYGKSDWNGLAFDVIDTGGLEPTSEDQILTAMRRQTEMAIDEADLILFIGSAQDGLLPEDAEILRLLRKAERPFLLVVNKADNPRYELLASEFYSLGIEAIHPISAEHGIGVGDLLDAVTTFFQENPELLKRGEEGFQDAEEEDRPPKIAVIGRPNVGKSTLINRILGEERLLAMPIPGTTRDAIEVPLLFKGREYTLVDTAGIRRQKYVKERLEKISIAQTLGALDHCDIAFFLLDATEPLSEQDAKVAGFAHNKGRGLVLVVNKWDAAEQGASAMKEFEEKLRDQISYLQYAPVVFCSALTGMRLTALFETADKVIESYRKRITTGELNRFFEAMIEHHPPPIFRGKPIKFYYITQVQTCPPTFLISANHPDAAHVSYQRFIINSLREEFGFFGVPIKLVFRRHR